MKTLQEIAQTLKDTDFPRQITLELCAYCNLRCIMCPHPGMKRSRGLMHDELYRQCIDEIAYVNPDTETWLADHGESLMIGSAVIDKVRYAKSKGLRKVYLNTNGMLLTQKISRGLVDAGLDGIYFGIDASTEETHAKIRVGSQLNTVIHNIENLLEEIKLKGRYPGTPEVWVQFIEMNENEGEREDFIQFWSAKRVGVKVRRKLSWGGYITSPQVQALHGERIPCPWMMNLMHVFWDGRVGRCTGDHEGNYIMGNVLDTSIKSIWEGPLRKEREIHLAYRFDLVNDQCKKCLDWKVGAADKVGLE